jgi:hypothetical protein
MSKELVERGFTPIHNYFEKTRDGVTITVIPLTNGEYIRRVSCGGKIVETKKVSANDVDNIPNYLKPKVSEIENKTLVFEPQPLVFGESKENENLVFEGEK